MWIVRLALARPYTFVVMALVIILLTPVVLLRTPVDIFPDINIPVISLVWTYNGLQPQEMEQRITSNVERGITTLVNDVEHIESQSLNGIAVIKVYFQPGANIQTALAQAGAISQTFLRYGSCLCERRLDVCAGLEVDLDDGNPVQRLRFDVLNVVDQRGDTALDVGSDALLHFLGLQAVVGPDETDDRNVDIGKNVDRGSEEHNRRQQNNHERHHDKGVWPRQR